MRHELVRQPRQGRAPPRPAQDVLALRRVEVVRTYLVLDDPSELRPASGHDPTADLVRHSPCPVPLYRRLYHEVGERWYWHDRLEWSDAELADHLASESVSVWELLVRGESAGYFELQRHQDGSVEIAYFGLREPYIGRGFGGLMLTRAVRESWEQGAARVWLHTCTLDSPNALPAYRARGFRPYKTERLEVDLDGTRVVAERIVKSEK